MSSLPQAHLPPVSRARARGLLRLRLARMAAIGVLGLSLFAAPGSAAVPHDMTYQGRLTDTVGAPLAGPVDLTFRIYDVLTGGSRLYDEDHLGVVLDDEGSFSVQLGAGTPTAGTFDVSLFSGINRYLEVTVDGEVLAPRQVLASVPWALISEEASTVQGQDVVAQLGTLGADVATAQSTADAADLAASSAQVVADANAVDVGTLTTDLAAVEATLGSLPEGETVAGALTELGQAALSDTGTTSVVHSLASASTASTSIAVLNFGLPVMTHEDSGNLIFTICAFVTDCSVTNTSTIYESSDTSIDPFLPVLSGSYFPIAVGADGRPVVVYKTRQSYGPGPGPDSETRLYIFRCSTTT